MVSIIVKQRAIVVSTLSVLRPARIDAAMFVPGPLPSKQPSKQSLFNKIQKWLDRASGYVEPALHKTKPNSTLVSDSETGIQMFVRGTPEIDLNEVFVQFPWGSEITFYVEIKRKYEDRPSAAQDRSKPAILLRLREFAKAIDSHRGTFEKNSAFIRYLLSGLSLIKRHRGIGSTNRYFYSDLDDYKGRENMFPFSFPSNEEIANL
jgi:hypothetical protein